MYDSSGYDHHGTLNNGVSTGASGVVGEAHSFDDTDDTINVGNDLPQSTPLSVSGWMYIDSNNTQEADMIGNYDNHSSSSWIFRVINDSMDMWFSTSHNSTSIDITERDQFLHLAVTVNSSNNITYYKNSDTTESITTSDNFGSTTNDFRLASRGDSDTRCDLLGRLDDVRVYDRALSANEVSTLYQMRTQRHVNL